MKPRKPPHLHISLLRTLSSPRHRRLLRTVALYRGEDPEASSDPQPQPPSSPSTTVAYSDLLAWCASARSLPQVQQVHAHSAKSGASASHPFRNHLIAFYSQCRSPEHARKLFDEIPHPDITSWSALLSAYVRSGLHLEALRSFRTMHSSGLRCNGFVFPTVLKACSGAGDLGSATQIHAAAVTAGFESDAFVASSLVGLYAKFGCVADSKRLFEGTGRVNAVPWTALVSACVRSERFGEAIEAFREMVSVGPRPDRSGLACLLNACSHLEDLVGGRILHGYLMHLGYSKDAFPANALVVMYSKLGEFTAASMAFEEMVQPDVVAWNSFIAGCVLCGRCLRALELLVKMRRLGNSPNMFTLSSCLEACAEMGFSGVGQQIHALSIKAFFDSELSVCARLVDMYVKCGCKENARKVFDSMAEHELVSWNALISGCSHTGHDKDAISLFWRMHRGGFGFDRTTLSAVLMSAANLQALHTCKQIHALSVRTGLIADVHVINGLIDAYGKCHRAEDAVEIFGPSPVKDVVSFTSMIAAFLQCGRGEEALGLFLVMMRRRLKPDSFMCSILFNSCARLSAYEPGKQMHALVFKIGSVMDSFVGTALVYMYGKCGSAEDARLAFSEIPEKGIVSWSVIIGGLAQHGHGKEALDYFNQMLEMGLCPNHITLTSVLCACNHAGLIDKARYYFNSMKEMFGVERTPEHYACMVDLLGRAGELDEAVELVDTMPSEANVAAWGALLGASKIHRNIELGRRAAEMLFRLEPERPGNHVLLANTYASAEKWDDVAEVRQLMKCHNLKKEPAISWIEVRDQVHTFIVGDRSHPRTAEIYAKLDEMNYLMHKAGYVPMVEIDLHGVERSEKEVLLSHHSERLAVAFGLIGTPEGAPIRVKKNLRICQDCHTAFKIICKIVSREIIIRDVNRFHHFRDGHCSCGDYW